MTFRFRGKTELNEIYTNSWKASLSNGLKIGQSVKAISERLGLPKEVRRLRSGKGDQLVFPVGSFDLYVIRMDYNPDTAVAFVLRTHVIP